MKKDSKPFFHNSSFILHNLYMADLEKTVSILFKGVDEVSTTMDKIGGSLSNLGTSLESATQPFANMALAVEKFEATLAVLAAGGIVAAVSAAGKFQAGLNEIHTLLRESPEDVAAFDDAIENYARNSTQSLEDIQAAIYQALSANVDYRDSIQFITEAEKLAVAGQSTLKESVDLLTSVMSAYGASWSDANQYSDIFFKTVEIGKVNVPQLASALGLVAPAAAISGVSIKEVSAALAALTAGGLTSSQAAEYLRQVISDLVKPSDSAVSAFENLKIKFGSAELASVGLSGKMQEIWEKSGGSADSIIKLFGNVTSFSAASVLGADKAGLYAKALDELNKAAGATDRAYQIMVDNIDKVNTRLINSMKLALVEAGKPLLDDWENIANALGKVFQGVQFGLKEGAFSEIYTAIESFASEFADYLRKVAAAIPEAMQAINFEGLLASVKELGGAVGDVFKTLFGDLDLTKPEDMAKAMQKIVDGITAMNNVTKGIVEGLKPFVTALGEFANDALNADGKTAELTGKILGFGQGVNTAISAVNSLAPAMEIFSGSLILKAISNLGGLASIVGALPFVAAGAAATGLAYAVNQLNPPIDLANAKFDEFGNLMGDFNNMYAEPVVASVGEIGQSLKDIPGVTELMFETDMDSAINQIQGLNENLLEFEAGVSVLIDADPEPAQIKIGELSNKMADYDGRKYSADFEISDESYDKTMYRIMEVTSADGFPIQFKVRVDDESITKSENKIKEIPTEKMLEIKLQGDIDTEIALIKADAEMMQKAVEWSAKLEIANIESQTERVKAMFSSVSDTIGRVSSEISGLFGKIPKSEYDFGAREWQAAVNQAMQIQDEAFRLEKQLVAEQIKLMETKDDLMKSGKGLIKIDSTGLEPALEMIMWQILQKVQLKANEDSASFLLGIN
jgi:TP901 family phage tail tape measure protein